MSMIFKDLNFVKVYMDDILIHSNSITEHKNHVISVLETLINNNISINFEKTIFL